MFVPILLYTLSTHDKKIEKSIKYIICAFLKKRKRSNREEGTHIEQTYKKRSNFKVHEGSEVQVN